MGKRNIIIAMFDSLPPRFVRQWGGDIDFLPKESLDTAFLLTRCYTAATITIPSISSMFTGTYPMHHGVTSHWARFLSKLDPSTTTLAEVLKSNGYKTICGVPGKFKTVTYEAMGLSKGFDIGFNIVSSCKSREPMSNALELTEPHVDGQPFFAWHHHFVTHIPYGYPAGYGGWLRYKWKCSISMEEACKRRIARTAELIVKPTYEFAKKHDAILLLISDHGEVFISETEGSHAEFLEEDNARALCAFLGIDKGVNDELHSLVDLMPTILGLVGIESPPCDGVDAFRTGHEEVYCINEQTAGVKMSAVITKDAFKYSELQVESRLRLEDEKKVLARLRALGYSE